MTPNKFNNLSIDDRKALLKDDHLLCLYCIELASLSQSKNPSRTAANFMLAVQNLEFQVDQNS